jgi:drug/metabolite transporter (DMT)-like permease
MQSYGALDAVPLWSFFVAVLLLVVLSVEAGYRLGRFRRSRSEQEVEAPLGAMVGATLGLLAFMLAFTFGAAADRYDSRRQILLDEANAIGTTYLRAGMLPDRREEIRALLRDYVDTRLQAVRSNNVAEGIRRSEQLHDQLWAQAVHLGETNPASIVVGLFVTSLNEVIDIHAKRVTVSIRNRIPGAIWLALLAVAVVALAAMGYHVGVAGTGRSLAQVAVALTFSVVIGLIADLDRPQEGSLTVSQQALVDLRQSMNGPQPPYAR